jgi:diamine N-acetyltransferase
LRLREDAGRERPVQACLGGAFVVIGPNLFVGKHQHLVIGRRIPSGLRVTTDTFSITNRLPAGRSMMQIPSTVTIRPAVSQDASALAAFAARTFEQTFANDNTSEDMAAYLTKTYGEPQQRQEIDDRDGLTLLAEEGGGLIAFAQVRRQAPPSNIGEAPVELRRFYVDRSYQGRGVAQVLMRAAEDAARQLGGRTFWLGVWERNLRAIAFYAKVGFVDTGTQVFVLGSDVQTDRVMARPLTTD